MIVRSYYEKGPITRDVLFPLQGTPPELAQGKECVGMWLGERRAPKQGEWYIRQGKAHRAEGDMTRVYPIARIHPIRQTGLVEIEAFPVDRTA